MLGRAMTINDAPRAPLRSCKGKQRHDEVRLLSCVAPSALRQAWETSGRVHPTDATAKKGKGRVYDSSVQALDSRRARRTTRVVKAPA